MNLYLVSSVNRKSITHSRELSELIKFCWSKLSGHYVSIFEVETVAIDSVVQLAPSLSIDGGSGRDEVTLSIDVCGFAFLFTVFYRLDWRDDGSVNYITVCDSASAHLTDYDYDFDEKIDFPEHLSHWLAQLADDHLTVNQYQIDYHIDLFKNEEPFEER